MKRQKPKVISSSCVNPRARAVQILQQVVFSKASLQECLSPEDTPFIYQLTYGTLRFYHALSAMVNGALKQPLSPKDQDIYLLILLGIYQIQHLDIPEYAILQETVNVAVVLKKIWAKNLVNAILRRFLRERVLFEQQCLLSEEAKHSHPQWLIERIKVDWPKQWESILMANNEKAPMHLRVNRLKTSRETYKDILNQAAIKSNDLMVSDGLQLEQAIDVYQLPHFSEGWISVQDAASQAVVDCLDLQAGQRVLDACAAPGGKTGHMLEREPALAQVVALDISAERLKKITENLDRLACEATLLCGDAALPETWWDKKPFHRILMDAPCSATGVIRRHPDIKLLRTPKEIQQVVEKQKRILESLWKLLLPQGRLIYTTCSVLKEENEGQIKTFLASHSEAKLISMKQVLPGVDNVDNSDGFFYAVLELV